MANNDTLKFLNIDESLYKTRISKGFENRKKYEPADPKKIMSFIPGTILDIMVIEGQKIERGHDMMILEAMKMQNRIKSAITGRVKKIYVSKGDKVARGTLLLEMEL